MPKTVVKDNGHERELHRNWESIGHNFGDGDSGEGGSEVQHENALDVEQVLDNKRLVEVVFGLDPSASCLGETAVAAQGFDRIAGHQEDKCVDEEGGSEEHRNHLEHSSPDIAQHSVVLY